MVTSVKEDIMEYKEKKIAAQESMTGTWGKFSTENLSSKLPSLPKTIGNDQKCSNCPTSVRKWLKLSLSSKVGRTRALNNTMFSSLYNGTALVPQMELWPPCFTNRLASLLLLIPACPGIQHSATPFSLPRLFNLSRYSQTNSEPMVLELNAIMGG
ncbi:hypothetical protein Trydic_g4825 [Trypoxylus dichotomus]